jgi:hypothetical protein
MRVAGFRELLVGRDDDLVPTIRWREEESLPLATGKRQEGPLR